MIKYVQGVFLAILFVGFSGYSSAADKYVIDTKGAHAFIQFKASHLGYSWLYGRFNDFSGEFTYDAKNDKANSIELSVDVASIDSNHAERDKHLRDSGYLNTNKYKTATFKSKSYTSSGENKAKLVGDLTLMGVTKEITLDVDVIGGGPDPWGGYRQGFSAIGTIATKDFGMKKDMGEIELIISLEGIKK